MRLDRKLILIISLTKRVDASRLGRDRSRLSVLDTGFSKCSSESLSRSVDRGWHGPSARCDSKLFIGGWTSGRSDRDLANGKSELPFIEKNH
jgi:hypothetical protein